LGQESFAAFNPACNDASGLAGTQRFSQNGMEKASYGASVFGKQLLRKSGLARDSSEIGIASFAFGKAPEVQPSFNDIPQLQTGIGERGVQAVQDDVIRPCRPSVPLLPAQSGIKHKNGIEVGSIVPQTEGVLAAQHGGQCHVLF